MPARVDLSVEHVLSLAHAAGLSCPEWKWPRLKTYRGFTHEQRVRGHNAMVLAIRMKLLAPPREFVCQHCGGSDRMQYHAEDYNTLDGLIPLCQRCHLNLHRSETLRLKNVST